MLTPLPHAPCSSAPLLRTRAAVTCVSLLSVLLLQTPGFAQTQPAPAPAPPPPPAATPPAAPPAGPATALPPPPQAPPTAQTPPPGYAPPGYAPPGYAPQPGYGPPPGYAPPQGYGPPGEYGQTPPGYGPMPPGYGPYYGPYYGAPPGPPPPEYRRHNTGMMVGGVLLTTAGILGTLIGAAVTSTAANQIPIYCNQGFGVTICEERTDEAQQGVGIGVLVTSLVAIGVGIPLWVIGGKRVPVTDNPADQPSAAPAPSAPKTSLELVVSPSSAHLRATF